MTDSIEITLEGFLRLLNGEELLFYPGVGPLMLRLQSEARQEIRREILNECAMIAALESRYWAEIEDDQLQDTAMGGMGAAANVCGALAQGLTVAQFKETIKARDMVVSPPR